MYYGVRELLGYEAKTKTFGFSKTAMADQRVIVQGFGNGVCVCVSCDVFTHILSFTQFQVDFISIFNPCFDFF